MNENKFKFSVSEQPSGADFQIEISSGAQRWLVQRSQSQCLEFLRQTQSEFGKPAGEVLSLSPSSLKQALEVVYPDDRDPLKSSALFSFVQDLDKTSWSLRAHVRSLEAKIDQLSSTLHSYESKFEQLDKIQSLLSSIDSESLSLSSLCQTSTSSLSQTPLCVTARDNEKKKEKEVAKENDFSCDDDLNEQSLSKENTAENTFSLFTSVSETSCFDDGSLSLDKKKWEEVSLSREPSAVGNSSNTVNAISVVTEDALLDDSALLNSYFAADNLLTTNSESCPLDNMPEEALESVFHAIDGLLKAIQPHETQLQYRAAATAFVRKQVRLALGALSFESGLHAIHCFLPTDAVKLTLPLTQQQLAYWHGSLAERLRHIADRTTPAATPRSLELFLGGAGEGENEELSELFANNLRDVQVLANEQSVVVHAASASASSPTSSSAANNGPNASSGGAQSSNALAVVHFQLDGVECQVSANQRLELCNLAFLEEFASKVGRDRLFKRSLLLVRSWWEYESSSYAGVMMKPSLSEQTIAFMLVSVFNNYHHCITHPLEAFVLFLREFSAFDGLSQAITIQGLVPFQSSSHSSSSSALYGEREREGDSNVPCLVKPQPHQLVSQEMLEKYWQMFFVHEAASALSPSSSVSSSAAVSSLSNQLRLREAMLTSMQRSLTRFERNGFCVVHPFLFCNLVVDRSSVPSSVPSNTNGVNGNGASQQSRRLSLLPRVLQASYAAISTLLDQCKAQYALHVNHPATLENAVNELLQRFLPSVYPRLSSPFRPDALNNSIFLPSNLESDPNASNTESEDEKENALSEREFVDESRIGELLDIAGERLWESVAYCNFIAENVLTESAILSFCADTLAVKGPLPAGELGKLLSEASSIQSLSHKLREKFGGLKKFLERFPEKFIFSNDHPFNPHVLLRSAISKENLELIDRGIFPIHLISKSARAAAAQAAKKNSNNNNGQSGKNTKDGSSSKATSIHINNNISSSAIAAVNTNVHASAASAPSSPAAPYAALSTSLVVPSSNGNNNNNNAMNTANNGLIPHGSSNTTGGHAVDYGAMNSPFFAQHHKSLGAASVPVGAGRDMRASNNSFFTAAPQAHSHPSHSHSHHLMAQNAYPHAQSHQSHSHMRAFSSHTHPHTHTAYPQDPFASNALFHGNNNSNRDRDARVHGGLSFHSSAHSLSQSHPQHAYTAHGHTQSAAHASATRLRGEFFHANTHANTSRNGHGNARYLNESHSRGGHSFVGNSHNYGSSTVNGNVDLLNFPGVGGSGANGMFNTDDDFSGYSFHSLGRDSGSVSGGTNSVFSSANSSGSNNNNNNNNNNNGNGGTGATSGSANVNNANMSGGGDFFLEREGSGGFRGAAMSGAGQQTTTERSFGLGEDGALFLGDFSSHNSGNNFRFPPF